MNDMKRFLTRWVCLALALLLPVASGEGWDVPVDRFIQRAGIEADAALRQRIEAFLREKPVTARSLEAMPEARVRRYAEYLAAGRPISYDALISAEAVPLGAVADVTNIRQLAVLTPAGSATQSMLADFELGYIYYDEDRPVTADVCLASYVGELTEELKARLTDLLDAARLADWPETLPGDAPAGEGPTVVALAFDEGVARYTFDGASTQVPAIMADTALALLETASAYLTDME